MCTAVNYKAEDSYFGRNLDVERDYGEKVVITPKNFPLSFRCLPGMKEHYAFIGMAAVIDGYPLYFEATNEKGLSMAGLNFPDNADYKDFCEGKNNLSPFELIPYILGKCENITQVKKEIENLNIVKIHFSEKLPLSPLHWLIGDKEESLTLECVAEGLKVYENPYGILTNNPPFPYHLMNINNYMGLHEGFAENRFTERTQMHNCSLGMGAMGLPGDFSSASRFVRGLFVKEKSQPAKTEEENVSQFFHILSSVAMPKGCVLMADGQYEYTRYSCCCNADRGIYYYKTYYDSAVKQVDMNSVDLQERRLFIF